MLAAVGLVLWVSDELLLSGMEAHLLSRGTGQSSAEPS